MGWLDLIRAGSDLYGAHGECCPPVVDPYTFLALIAGISLITWFLQMVIVMTEFTPPDMMMGAGPGRRFRRDLHKDRPAQTGFYSIYVLRIKISFSVYDFMSRIMSDVLVEESDDEVEKPVENNSFQDNFKTEIKTRRKN